jgi:hypothetical protein
MGVKLGLMLKEDKILSVFENRVLDENIWI